ncbi:MAG: Mrp/NBP35 family ATP-binding protein [Desulfovibrio sp.]|nr:Mrp/NBP35 family ATP-binding protein [Desulfovibrio sp.]
MKQESGGTEQCTANGRAARKPGCAAASCAACAAAEGDGAGHFPGAVPPCAAAPHPEQSGPERFDREQRRAAFSSPLPAVKYKLFVMSGKGGVGKSSVAVNVAAALALAGRKVGIVDADLHGPSVAGLLGSRACAVGADEASGKLLPAEFMPNLHFISMAGVLRDRDRAVIWRGPKKSAAVLRFIKDVAWGELDFLIVDSPPGTGDEHLTVLKALPDILAVIVTTPQELSLADVRRALGFLKTAGGKILGLAENMSGLSCPHCGGDIRLFKKGGGRLLAEEYGIPFLGEIPLDPAAVLSADLGLPLAAADGDGAAARAFAALAAEVDARCRAGAAVDFAARAE